MIIRPDEVQKIEHDRFTSMSGKWLCLLCSSYEPHRNNLRAYYVVIILAATQRVRKVVRLGYSWKKAEPRWEDFKQIMTVPSEHDYEDEIPTGLSEAVFSWPIINEEDQQMALKMRPRGGRIFARDITPVDEVTVRAEQAGLVAVVAEENKPRATMAIVVAVGEDPLAQELYREGQIVMFSKFAGHTFMEAGQSYRVLELHEIIGVREPEEGVEDLMPPKSDAHLGATEKSDAVHSD